MPSTKGVRGNRRRDKTPWLQHLSSRRQRQSRELSSCVRFRLVRSGTGASRRARAQARGNCCTAKEPVLRTCDTSTARAPNDQQALRKLGGGVQRLGLRRNLKTHRSGVSGVGPIGLTTASVVSLPEQRPWRSMQWLNRTFASCKGYKPLTRYNLRVIFSFHVRCCTFTDHNLSHTATRTHTHACRQKWGWVFSTPHRQRLPCARRYRCTNGCRQNIDVTRTPIARVTSRWFDRE